MSEVAWPSINFGPINLWNLPKMDSNIEYSKIIEEVEEKGYQVRLVVNEFRGVHYLQLRKYFLTYDGTWEPSREGVSIPASTENIYALLDGVFDICSKAEGSEIIEHYASKLRAEK